MAPNLILKLKGPSNTVWIWNVLTMTACIHVPTSINVCPSNRMSVWEGNQTPTGNRWRGLLERSWSAGSLMIWVLRSVTRRCPLSPGPALVLPPHFPQRALNPAQTEVATCNVSWCSPKQITLWQEKKKNSIGNSPSTVQEAYDAKTVCVEQNNHC